MDQRNRQRRFSTKKTHLLEEVESKVREVVRLGNTSEPERILCLDVGIETVPGLKEFEEVEQSEIILLSCRALSKGRQGQTSVALHSLWEWNEP